MTIAPPKPVMPRITPAMPAIAVAIASGTVNSVSSTTAAVALSGLMRPHLRQTENLISVPAK
jgi:hypothetical protein